LHMAQLMPLPLTVSCFSKIQIGFTFLVPAHPGSHGQRAVKRVCVPSCARANTIGNNYKLVNHSFIVTYATIFSAHIVNICNSLPNSVVDASIINAFKAQLDQFWMHQVVK